VDECLTFDFVDFLAPEVPAGRLLDLITLLLPFGGPFQSSRNHVVERYECVLEDHANEAEEG
jgi:hypothetical protein